MPMCLGLLKRFSFDGVFLGACGLVVVLTAGVPFCQVFSNLPERASWAAYAIELVVLTRQFYRHKERILAFTRIARWGNIEAAYFAAVTCISMLCAFYPHFILPFSVGMPLNLMMWEWAYRTGDGGARF